MTAGSVTRCLMKSFSSGGTARKNSWNVISSVASSGRTAHSKPFFSVRSLGYSQMTISSDIDPFRVGGLGPVHPGDRVVTKAFGRPKAHYPGHPVREHMGAKPGGGGGSHALERDNWPAMP